MHILFLTNYYYPEVGASSYLYQELAQSLRKLGHQVTVCTGFPRYNIRRLEQKYRQRLWMRESIAGIEVLRIKTLSLPKYVPLARGLDYLGLSACLSIRSLFAQKPDVVMVYSPPIFLGLSALLLRSFKGTPFVFNVHDLFPQTAIDLGMLKNPALIKLFQSLEQYLYRNADWVTTHSSGNSAWVVAHGGDQLKTTAMPIWMDAEKLKPGPCQNAWRRSQKLNDSFVVVSAGTQGFNQDIAVILKAAERLVDHPDIAFLMIGDGAQHDEMKAYSEQVGLSNVRWLDWQPREAFPSVMHTADVVLATLKAEVSTPVVPSKILSAMSAGRPVITCMPMTGDAPKLVQDANSGIILAPGDDKALAEAILALYQDDAACRIHGGNGRLYVERHLDVGVWAQKYLSLFRHIIAPAHAKDALPPFSPTDNMISGEYE